MAVEKIEDGTYRVGGMSFATPEQAFDYDAATKASQSSVERPAPAPVPAPSPARAVVVAPQSTRFHRLTILAVLVAVAIAGALYVGPHWTIYRMKAAIDAKDATAFSRYVDFPSLKESFKAQLLVKMGELMNSDDMKGNPFAGLGQMIGMGMVNQMVDTLVSPAGVMLMMEQGKARPDRTTPTEAKAAPSFRVDYVNYSTAEIRPKDGTPGKFVFRRDGLFAWKLSAVELPI